MWGNSLGWSISALIVLAVGGWVYLIERGAAVARPTEFSAKAAHFEPLKFPEPSHIALGPVSADCDAGPLYRRAIELYLQDRATYSNFAATGTLDAPQASQLAAIEPIVEAASCARMNLFAADPTEIISYASRKPAIEALETLGRICIDRLALLSHRAGNTAEAKKYYRAGFMLGLNLARERITWAELELGLQLLGKAAPMLAELESSAGRAIAAAAFSDFDARRAQFAAGLAPTLRILRSIDPQIVGAHAGDVFELARRSEERMWRVEAMLALGRLRHFAGHGGTAATQRAAVQFLRVAAEREPDPLVRAAARAARDLTVEQHRMQ